MISPQTVERIKQAARIEEVVGEFVQLKKRGANWIGLCPFHQEKTPSFTVNISRNIYKCFGCGKGGDSIGFLEEHEHLNYPEALRWLAGRYQIDIEEEQASPEQQAEMQHRESLLIANQYAAQWFANQLQNSEEGRNVGLAYFQERGFRQPIIEAFGLGWCPENGDAFTRDALEAGYQQNFLEELGLTKTRDGKARDFFRGRVLFPIHNLSGKVIAFGARTLRSGPGIPKYLNSPESLIYSKSAALYGFHQARRAIAAADLAYLVEGYTDVLSLHQAGIENVVASSGTALTAGQVRLIRRYTTHLTLLYDGDSAGIKAALRGTEIALEEGMQVRIVRLPDGDDPDSLAQRLGGEETKAFLDREAKDFVLFKTSLLLDEAGGDPIRKAELVRDVLHTISKVSDPITRSLYLKQTAGLLDVAEDLLIRESNRLIGQQLRKNRGESAAEEIPLPEAPLSDQHEQDMPSDPESFRERDLIRLLLELEPYTVEELPAITFVLEQISEIELEHPLYASVLQEFRKAMEQGQVQSARFFLENENKALQALALELLHKPYELSPNWEIKHEIAITSREFLVRKDIEKVVASLKAVKIDRMMGELQQRFNESLSTEEEAELLLMYRTLRQAKESLNQAAGIFSVSRK